MRASDAKLDLGEWLPDLQDLDNPGLTEANNVVFYDGAYRPFKPLNSTLTLGSGQRSDALSAQPYDGLVTDGGGNLWVGLWITSTQQALYKVNTGTGSVNSVGTAGGYNSGYWDFAQYDAYIIATNGVDRPQASFAGASFTALAASGTAPTAYAVGVIGQFVIFGNTGGIIPTGSYYINWSAIDDPTDWPTPGTSDATQKQSGAEALRYDWGNVVFIDGNDQFGIVVQEGGITRVTYIGGENVFQFDEIEEAKGTEYGRSIVRYGRVWYYFSPSGFFVTDGVTCTPIGAGKIDKWVLDRYVNITGDKSNVVGAVDPHRKVIFWLLNDEDQTYATKIVTYNIETGRFTHCDENADLILTNQGDGPEDSWFDPDRLNFWAFDSSHVGRRFNGTVGTATITSQEIEINPGGRGYINGVKPNVELAAGDSPLITVALGTRDGLSANAVSYSSESTINTRTGVANFRKDAKYARARIKIAGDFKLIKSFQVEGQPSGEA